MTQEEIVTNSGRLNVKMYQKAAVADQKAPEE